MTKVLQSYHVGVHDGLRLGACQRMPILGKVIREQPIVSFDVVTGNRPTTPDWPRDCRLLPFPPLLFSNLRYALPYLDNDGVALADVGIGL